MSDPPSPNPPCHHFLHRNNAEYEGESRPDKLMGNGNPTGDEDAIISEPEDNMDISTPERNRLANWDARRDFVVAREEREARNNHGINMRSDPEASLSYDEEIYNPDGEGVHPNGTDSDSSRAGSDKIGQMQRGFADMVDGAIRESGSSSSSDTAANKTSSDELETAGSFSYGDKMLRSQLTKEEIISVAIHDLKLSHKLTRASSTDIASLLKNCSDSASCWDYRTTKKWIGEQTGVKSISYDCCRNSCMAFAMYPNKEECDYCQLPRWKPAQKAKSPQRVPFAAFEYIPIIHRLRLWYADPDRAATMTSYRRHAELQGSLYIP